MENAFYTYKTYGNITNKSDVGGFIYEEETAGPHALTSTGLG